MAGRNGNTPPPLPRSEELMDELINTPGSMGNTYNRFWNYSLRNQLWLRMQGATEPVASYKRWQTLGRQVVKGASAYYVLRPITLKSNTELDDKGKPKTFTKFKAIKGAFPVSMTEGDPLPEVEPKDWNLSRALGALAIKRTPFTETNGNVQGYSIGNEFAVNPVAPYPFKTTIHEIGHIALGHTAPDAHEDYVRHRGTKEFQAESTAYIVLNELELTDHMDAGESRAYIRNWLHDEQPDEAAIKPVFATVDRILKAGRAVPEATSE